MAARRALVSAPTRQGARWADGMRSSLQMGPPGIWWHNPDLVQKLTLTPDQQKRMDDILQQSRLQLVDLKANVEKQELLMEPMLAANPPDTNKVLAQIDRTAQARAELEKARAKMLLSIRNVLTPDQWTKLQAEERDNRRSRMMHGGMRGGNPTSRGTRGDVVDTRPAQSARSRRRNSYSCDLRPILNARSSGPLESGADSGLAASIGPCSPRRKIIRMNFVFFLSITAANQ